MYRFLQLHLLTSYPPSNLNRDDLGRPKTAIMGNARRLRVSSQSLKRAWRTSDLFADAMKGHTGVRTKEIGVQVCQKLVDSGIEETSAREWTKPIVEVLGKQGKVTDRDPQGDLKTEQLVHVGPAENTAIERLVSAMAERGSGPTGDELDLLRHAPGAVDIALFGRMLASNPSYGLEAACQVAHAISVNEVEIEDDFFTAVDDLNRGIEDVGAGHMGETEFGAGLFYLYVCIDQALLARNLDGDQELASRGVAALVEAAAKVAPTGKQASFASRAYASFILAEKGDQQPRSLSVAFLDPLTRGPLMEEAIKRLTATREQMDKVYGACSSEHCTVNAHDGTGSLDELVRCAME